MSVDELTSAKFINDCRADEVVSRALLNLIGNEYRFYMREYDEMGKWLKKNKSKCDVYVVNFNYATD